MSAERGSLTFICTEHFWSSQIAGCPGCFKEKRKERFDKLMQDVKDGKVTVKVKKEPHGG